MSFLYVTVRELPFCVSDYVIPLHVGSVHMPACMCELLSLLYIANILEASCFEVLHIPAQNCSALSYKKTNILYTLIRNLNVLSDFCSTLLQWFYLYYPTSIYIVLHQKDYTKSLLCKQLLGNKPHSENNICINVGLICTSALHHHNYKLCLYAT